MKHRPLGTRLALTSGLAALFMLVLGIVVLRSMQGRQAEAMVRTHLQSVLLVLKQSYLEFDAQLGKHPVADTIDEISRLEWVHSVEIRDASGIIRHQSLREKSSPAHPLVVLGQIPQRQSCINCHGSAPAPLGEVTIIANGQVAATGMWHLRRVVLLVLILVVIGVVFTVSVLVRRMISTPLAQLALTMGQAEEGDFLVRAVVKRNDEIGLLAATFNKMLSALTQLKATEIEQAQDLAQAHKELIFQKQLEERNSVIEQTNADLEKRLEELTLLLDLTRSVTSTLELDAVLDEISRRVGQAMGVDEFAILLFDNRGRRLKVVSTFGVPNNVDLTQLQFRLGEGLSGRVAQSGQSIVVNDTAAEPRYLYYKGLRPQDGSFLSVPLIAKGSVIGVLDFFRAQKNSFDEHSVALLTIVAGQAALAIENAKLFAAQSELALTDPLTQLANRRSLEQRLIEEVHRAQRFENTLSLLMIDIDHFKEFNDAHGHLLGDHVLKQVARTLKRHVRTVDTVARYGGEEFCVVLVRTDIQRALAIAEKLRDAVENKTYARIREDRRIKITISLGVATLSPNRSDPTALIDAADQALYAAKNNGRNQVVSAQQQHNEL